MATRPAAGRSAARALFLATFAVLWALSARQPPSGDATAMVSVARGLVTEGRLDSSYPMAGFTVQAPDGRHFSKYPLAQSLVEVPGQALERLVSIAGLPPADTEVALRLARGLTPAAVGALAVMLLFLALAEAGVPRRRAAGMAVLAGGATCLLPYLVSHYSEALQAAAVNATVGALARLERRPGARSAGLLGLCLGGLVFAKPALLPFAAIAGGAGAWLLVRDVERPGRAAGWMALAMLPGVAATVAWNWVRFGQPASVDYGFFLVPQTLGLPAPAALFGLLLSPGRGLLWFAPLAVLAIPGFRRAWREGRVTGVACGLGFVALLLLYSGFSIWHGSEQWGPRYLVPAIGPLAVLVAMAIGKEGASRRARRAGLAVLVAAGIAVNLPGLLVRYTDFFAAVPYTPYSAIHLDAQGRPLTPPETDNLFRTNFVPQFSPIAGHPWLLRHAILGGDLAGDCPWAGLEGAGPRIRTADLDPRIDLWFVPEPDWPASTVAVTLALLAVLLVAAVGSGIEAFRATG